MMAHYLYWPNNLHFRSQHSQPLQNYRPPVVGGRWMVRRQPRVSGPGMRVTAPHKHEKKPWRAWSTGRAKKHNKWFETYDEAIAHAQKMAMMYRRREE